VSGGAVSPFAARLAWVDDADDRQRSDDGVSSRYGAYLRERAGQFVEGGEGGEPVSIEWFAALAWKIAQSPVMVPGYLQVRPDLGRVDLRRAEDDEEPGLLVAEVAVPVGWPAGLRERLGRGWQSWSTEWDWAAGQEVLARFPPREARKPAVLLAASVQVPILASALPARRRRELDTGDAKRVVRAVCRRVDEVAGPAVAALRDAL
jgi:hypothetical protein